MGRLTVAGRAASFDAGGAGTTIFLNEQSAVFDDATQYAVVFNMDVVNNGTIDPRVGSVLGLTFDDDLSGTGSVEIGSTLVTINGPVTGGGQELSFIAPTGSETPTLTINDVQQFHGVISGFGSSDLLSVDTAAWQYQDFVANNAGTGGALMFTNGGAETAVNLSGGYDPSGFHAAVSGNQTTITYTG